MRWPGLPAVLAAGLALARPWGPAYLQRRVIAGTP
jgi:hypothetical protein